MPLTSNANLGGYVTDAAETNERLARLEGSLHEVKEHVRATRPLIERLVALEIKRDTDHETFKRLWRTISTLETKVTSIRDGHNKRLEALDKTVGTMHSVMRWIASVLTVAAAAGVIALFKMVFNA